MFYRKLIVEMKTITSQTDQSMQQTSSLTQHIDEVSIRASANISQILSQVQVIGLDTAAIESGSQALRLQAQGIHESSISTLTNTESMLSRQSIEQTVTATSTDTLNIRTIVDQLTVNIQRVQEAIHSVSL